MRPEPLGIHRSSQVSASLTLHELRCPLLMPTYLAEFVALWRDKAQRPQLRMYRYLVKALLGDVLHESTTEYVCCEVPRDDNVES